MVFSNLISLGHFEEIGVWRGGERGNSYVVCNLCKVSLIKMAKLTTLNSSFKYLKTTSLSLL